MDQQDNNARVDDKFPRYPIYLLFSIYTLSFIDRQIVNILAEPIKADLHISDAQLGALTGLAFALLYTILGIPVARIAERFNRSWLISASLFIWSAFTAACGLAHSFWQLLIFRIVVGLGEAGCSPPAQTLISDMTPKSLRARALAFYAMGVPVGSMLGMVIGGFVLQISGWRMAFLIVGLPGILVALLTLLTLRDPRHRAGHTAMASDIPPLGQALRELLRTRSFVWLSLGASMTTFVAYGQQAFYGSFFLRNHEAQVAALGESFGLGTLGFLGTALGLILGLAGATGTMTGGVLSDRLVPREPAAYAYIPAVASVLAMPLFVVALLLPSAGLSLLGLVIPSVLAYMWFGPVFAAIQGIVHPRSRATAVAVFLFAINAIGLGLGPLTVGIISDTLAPSVGPAAALRWALVGATLGGLLAAVFFWRAAAHLRADLKGS